MRASLTGTPGTGKSTAARVLEFRGHRVIEMSDFARDHGLLSSFDEERGSYEVDGDELDRAVQTSVTGDAVLVGHLSHLVASDVVIVLRCRPSVLESRLKARGWPEAKVRENMEAEAVDVVLVDALDGEADVTEIDATSMTPEEVADAVEAIISGERERYAVGGVDWSDEVMSWY